MAKKRKRHGHYCRCCGRVRPNERYSGSGHARHLCKDCSKLDTSELQHRQDLRTLERLVTWEGIIGRKKRKAFSRFLEHHDSRIRRYAEELDALDRKARVTLRYPGEADFYELDGGRFEVEAVAEEENPQDLSSQNGTNAAEDDIPFGEPLHHRQMNNAIWDGLPRLQDRPRSQQTNCRIRREFSLNLFRCSPDEARRQSHLKAGKTRNDRRNAFLRHFHGIRQLNFFRFHSLTPDNDKGDSTLCLDGMWRHSGRCHGGAGRIPRRGNHATPRNLPSYERVKKEPITYCYLIGRPGVNCPKTAP